METAALLSALRDRDVRLWTEEGRLRCSAPVGTLDAAMRATLASRKEELLALLRRAEMLKSLSPAIVPIKPEGGRPPVFAVSGHGGDVFWLRALARRLAPEQPVFGVQPPGLDGTKPLKSVEALARYEIEQIRRYRASGPYLIAGHCAGGIIAFEVAQQLTASGQQVALLALIGSPFPTSFHRAPQILLRLGYHVKALISGSLAERRRYITSKVFRRLRPPEVLAGVSPATLAAGRRVERATLAAVRSYSPRRYEGQVDLFVTADKWHRSQQWRGFAASVREHSLEGFKINDLLLGSHVEVLAAALQDRLNRHSPDSRPSERDLRPQSRWLLVTSAYHMPRAMGAFKKAGFSVLAFPAGQRTHGWQGLWWPSSTATDNLRRIDVAVHECLGLVAYRLSGYSDEWFPGP